MQKITIAIVALCLSACSNPAKKRETYDMISAEMSKAVAESQARPASAEAVSASLLPT
jgi:MSHA biogenesis protein MshL